MANNVGCSTYRSSCAEDTDTMSHIITGCCRRKSLPRVSSWQKTTFGTSSSEQRLRKLYKVLWDKLSEKGHISVTTKSTLILDGHPKYKGMTGDIQNKKNVYCIHMYSFDKCESKGYYWKVVFLNWTSCRSHSSSLKQIVHCKKKGISRYLKKRPCVKDINLSFSPEGI